MLTKRNVYRLLFITLLFLKGHTALAQGDEEYYEDLLNIIVEVENPVYKPVISLGAGVMGFYGDVRYPGINPISGKFGYKVNVSTMFGTKNYYKLNFFAILGSLTGHDFDISRQMQLGPLAQDENGFDIYPNSSFHNQFFQYGVNVEYGFGHLIGYNRRFQPFISVGFTGLQFNPKGNLDYGTDPITSKKLYYHYWSDGTMRDIPQLAPEAWSAKVVLRDKSYETDLSNKNLYDIGAYSQTSVAIPVEVGFDLFLSDRVSLRIASTLNYSLSDLLDNYNPAIAKKVGAKENGMNDIFTFTYFSLNLDMFSDPKTLRVERFVADLEGFDYDVFMADQDNDYVFDRWDLCPDTPFGVEVDSLGCPFDTDRDGIFDYMDKEMNTPQGATIDHLGVQLSQEKLAEMFSKSNAVSRKEIRVVPLASVWTRNITFTPGVIPAKFRSVDKDGDGYISFVELLKSIDDYFDEKTPFKPDDIYELNEFFFSQ